MKPILFNLEMAKAVYTGDKTQTRRVMKPQPPDWIESFGYSFFTLKGSISGRGNYKDSGPAEKFFKMPYQINDILYVRHQHYRSKKPHSKHGHHVWDEITRIIRWESGQKIKNCYVENESLQRNFKKCPSIHMPKWAAEIFLKVTGIRVERLQDITESDAIAEGFKSRSEFKKTWNSLYGNWNENPWVWVYDFEKIEKP